MMQSHNPNKDFEVTSPPDDSISSLAWSPKQNLLVAGSWDNQIRCWDVAPNGSTTPKAANTNESPVLCTSWSGDGQRVFSGLCDGKAKCWTLATNQTQQVAQHAAGIKAIFWVEQLQTVVTGSWDKTIKYWDGRSPNAVHTNQLPERVYCMDVKYPLCVVGTADRTMLIYDLRKPQTEYKRFPSPLKHQSRCVSAFIDTTGFALGSIEGRVAIHHVEDKDQSKNFAFKCHRENNDVYAVNSIAFHPTYGTFSTAGGDGTFNFWDKDSKQRLKPFSKCSAPITATSFNMDGTIFAYAVSYDWGKGAEGYNPQNKNYIFLHATQESEVKNRNPRR